jgi:predicted oxidoreductase (fatty acid repression mutant protein)
MMKKSLYDSIKDRRSIYGISKESVISDEKIEEVIRHAVKYAPSAFNSQSGRIVLLLGEQHNKLWDITNEILKKIVPEKNFKQTEEKIQSFRNGYGTILYFEDQNVVKGLQDRFPTYSDNSPIWSLQSSGMLQYIIWSSLEAEGFGASLQHYNPLIDDEVRKEWNIPENWKLLSQMPFGKPIAPAGEKEFKPLEERLVIYK